jgi:hypothetical protein
MEGFTMALGSGKTNKHEVPGAHKALDNMK